MTLQDLINWQKGASKARVRLGAGATPNMVDTLASKLAGVRGVVPDVEHYDDEEFGMRIRYTGDDQDGTPIFEIGSRPAGETRLPGYGKLDQVMGRIAEWGGSRPDLEDLEAPGQVMPSLSLRQKLIERLSGAPRPDRTGAARRGLESALVAGGLSMLAGGSGLGVGAAMRGGSRGVARAYQNRFLDDTRDWQNGVRADAEAVRQGDIQTTAINRANNADFQQSRDISRLKLDDWKAQGAPLQRELAAAIAELRGQQADEKEKNDAEQEAARGRDRDLRALSDANDDTIQLFGDLIEKNRVSGKAASELVKRIGIIRQHERLGEVAPAWVYELDGATVAAMSEEDKQRLEQRDTALEQAGRRLDIQERNAATAEGRLKASRDSLGERTRHNKAMESRPVGGGSRAVVDPIAGPKAGPVERYEYLVGNHDQLLEQKRGELARAAALDEVAKKRELTDREFFERRDIQASLDTLTRYLQSTTSQLAALESQYPKLRENFIKAKGNRNLGAGFNGSTTKKAAPPTKPGASTKPGAPAKKPPTKPAFVNVPGLGRVPVERK